MMKQLYKDSLADIKVSRELIYKTKMLMNQKRDSKPKHSMLVKYASMAVCFLFVMLAVIAFPKIINQMPSNNSFLKVTPPTSNPLEQQAAASSKDSMTYVNQLGNMIRKQPMSGGPAVNRIEKWTFKQYCELLGFNPLPLEIPKGLNIVKINTKNIFFQKDRRVDFYNTWGFVYVSSPEENAKSMTVNVNPSAIPYWSVPRAYQLKGEIQLTDVNELLELGKKSQINGTEVAIWHKDKGSVWNYMGGAAGGEMLEVTDYYCADFKYKGAGFAVTAQNGITQNEFVQVLKSIIK